MIGLGAPWWLVAFAVIPLIHWLHRWQAPLNVAPVSAAFLWDTAESLGNGGEIQQTPDSAWRRRALLAALLVLALAEPWWQRESGVVTVWIDDSVSMSAIEQGDARLATGFDELRQALQGASPADVTLRSLSDAARIVQYDMPGALDAGNWLGASHGEPDPPAAAMLSRESAHWLVTDGANERLLEWADSAPLERIIRVGSATENVAVTRFAARRSAGAAGNVDVLVAVTNRGKNDASRELQIISGERVLETRQLALLAGETQNISTVQVLGQTPLFASLGSGDVVEADDSLSLAIGTFEAVSVNIDTACPAALSLAVRSHPALAVAGTDAAPQLQLNCSDTPPIAPAILRFHTAAATPVGADVEWYPGVGRLQELHLPQDWVAAADWGRAPDERYETLLATAAGPLLVRRKDQPSVIETVIDMSRAEFVRQPEFAALIAGLIDLALGRDLLDVVAVTATDPEASNVVPSDVVVAGTKQRLHGTKQAPISNTLLMFAVLLLLADFFLLWRAVVGARRA